MRTRSNSRRPSNSVETLELPLQFLEAPETPAAKKRPALADELAAFCEFGAETRQGITAVQNSANQPLEIPTYVNEFWTARQRQASSLHEVSYRACFKPQLPRFFIERLSRPGDRVYDPFMGRGTTPLEAALLGRIPVGCDINPLGVVLARPRLHPPTLAQISERLARIDWNTPGDMPDELLVFYHPAVLRAVSSLRRSLLEKLGNGPLDPVDDWIRMVALNRLTGHSPGFFSVYTLPPNQAVSLISQRKINEKRRQSPPPRDVPALILKKSRQLLADCDAKTRQGLARLAPLAQWLTQPAHLTPQLAAESISLVVTSPPFLNIVQYETDNWLRCWFLGIDGKTVALTVPDKLARWQEAMTAVFKELRRLLKQGGHIAFEVGEVRRGAIKLEETALRCGIEAGLEPLLVAINDQQFTKTANCWGVKNMSNGTNTNRIVVFRKP